VAIVVEGSSLSFDPEMKALHSDGRYRGPAEGFACDLEGEMDKISFNKILNASAMCNFSSRHSHSVRRGCKKGCIRLSGIERKKREGTGRGTTTKEAQGSKGRGGRGDEGVKR
jgi:hypothetical protein